MKSSHALGLAAGAVCLTPAFAQDVRPFPLDVSATPSSLEVVYTPNLTEIQALSRLDRVVLTGLEQPGQGSLDLDLTRLNVERVGFGFQVDGAPRPDLLDNLDLSVWKGFVVGDPASEVIVSFSNYGSRGWIIQGDDVLHLIARPDATGDWIAGDTVAVTESGLNSMGMALGTYCESDSLTQLPAELFPPTPVGPPQPEGGGACNLKECTIALETDFQLFQVFGNLNAMTSYITTLLTAISDRYEGQIGTVLTFPYLMFYTSNNDGWSTPDSGGSTSDMLSEFVDAWSGNVPTGATLGHFVSGASLGGGIAYLDVLCNDEFNFGVSANIGGNVSFPIQQQGGNWDFMVIAHELGHNFSAPHTHDLGIDNCAGGDHITNGTVMSYCHLCPGGTANITTFFHPVNVNNMTNAANTCLPDFGGSIFGDSPALLSETDPTPVTAQVVGTPSGSIDLVYRYDGGAFQTIAMSNQGGNTYSADLPAAPCDADVEFYYTFTDADCGVVVDPAGAPGTTYGASVGTPVTILSDDFETDTGWSATNLGATSGDWQRGVPVNDGGWDYDPTSDFDGSGSAWLTQNEDGNTDVDDGSVRLTSPVFDMTSGPAVISYAYFLNLNNSAGTDYLRVEINSNGGGGGGWTEIAAHNTDGNLSWRTHSIDLASMGVNQTANMVLRFTANDSDPQSINEAGLDAFEIAILECDDGPQDGPYCTSDTNSTGFPSQMYISGSTSVAANNLTLGATNVPVTQFGVFYYGADQTSQPFGNGTRCVTGSQVFRLPVEMAQTFNILEHAFDNNAPPADAGPGQITAGATWNFQAWFRDPAGGGAFFDLSDGYRITFTP